MPTRRSYDLKSSNSSRQIAPLWLNNRGKLASDLHGLSLLMWEGLAGFSRFVLGKTGTDRIASTWKSLPGVSWW
jgi:hypothetical protein